MSRARDLTRLGPAFREVYRPHFQAALATLAGVDRVRGMRPGFWNRIESEFGDWIASVSRRDLLLLGDVDRALRLQATIHAVENATQMHKRPWPRVDCPRHYYHWSAWYGGPENRFSGAKLQRHIETCEDCARIAELVPRDRDREVRIPIRVLDGEGDREPESVGGRRRATGPEGRRSRREERLRARKMAEDAKAWLAAQSRLRLVLGGVLLAGLLVLASVWQYFAKDDDASAQETGPAPTTTVGAVGDDGGDGSDPSSGPDAGTEGLGSEGPGPREAGPYGSAGRGSEGPLEEDHAGAAGRGNDDGSTDPRDPSGALPTTSLTGAPTSSPDSVGGSPATPPDPGGSTTSAPTDTPRAGPSNGGNEGHDGPAPVSPWTLTFLDHGAPELEKGRQALLLNRRSYPGWELAELGLPPAAEHVRVLPAGQELVERGGEFWHRWIWPDGRALHVAYECRDDDARTLRLALDGPWTATTTTLECRVLSPDEARRELDSFRPDQRLEVLRAGRVVAFASCASEGRTLTVPVDVEQPFLYRLLEPSGRGVALELEPTRAEHALVRTRREVPGPSDPRLRRLLESSPRLVDELSGMALAATALAIVDPATGLARQVVPSSDSELYHPLPASRLDRLGAEPILAFRPRTVRCVSTAIDTPTATLVQGLRLEIVGAPKVGEDRVLLPPPPESLRAVRVRVHAPGYETQDLSIDEAARAAGAPLELQRTHRNLVLAFPDSRELRNALPRPPLSTLANFMTALRDRLRTELAAVGYEEVELWMVAENSARVLDEAATRGDLGASFLAADKPEVILSGGPLPSGEYSIYGDPELRPRLGPHTAVVALVGDFFAPTPASVRSPDRSIGHLHVIKLRADFDEPTWSWCVNNSDTQSSLSFPPDGAPDLDAAAATVSGEIVAALRARWQTPPR